MANIQQQFTAFHDAIKLGKFEESATLREKRDIIRQKLRERLPDVFKRHREAVPAYSFWDQGSYALDTGIQPLDGDYDIDQGVCFEVATSAYPDPVTLKERVHEALDGHTKDVRIRQPCVTVFYQEAGEPIYHVDLAVYSSGANNADGTTRLSRGKPNSDTANKIWEPSDPQGMADTILGRFSGEDRRQFRRIMRYLKRWRDENFPKEGHARPVGIGLTVAVYDNLAPTYFDGFARTEPDDLGALRPLVRAMLAHFGTVWDATEQRFLRRLAVTIPAQPWDDPFRRMSNLQMGWFYTGLEELRDALDAAAAEVDPVEACKHMRKVFGPDFPIPDKQETARTHRPAIASSSSSA